MPNDEGVAEIMEYSPSLIERYIDLMGKVRKLGAWVPRTLNDNNKDQRATIFDGLFVRHRSTHGYEERFIYRIVTGDEK